MTAAADDSTTAGEGRPVPADPPAHRARADAAPKPGVSVIIPHFSDLERLDVCLDALERQTWPRGHFEIIVGDNNSPEGLDAVKAVVRGRAIVTLITEKGPGPARNGAVAIARGDLLAFTDSDCIPDPDWLAQGVAALADYDLVGGAITVLVEDSGNMTAAEAYEVVFAFDNAGYVRRQGFSVTANMFCRKAVFERIGGFLSWVATEDLEWCHRATAAGFRLGFAPASTLGHPARRTWSELLTKTRRSNIGMYARATSGGGGRLRWLAKSLAMPFSAVAHTPRVLFDARLGRLGHRLKAVCYLFRVRLFRMTDGLRLLVRG